MRDGKAMGIDETSGELWKYGGDEVEEWVWGFCNKIWRGGRDGRRREGRGNSRFKIDLRGEREIK